MILTCTILTGGSVNVFLPLFFKTLVGPLFFYSYLLKMSKCQKITNNVINVHERVVEVNNCPYKSLDQVAFTFISINFTQITNKNGTISLKFYKTCLLIKSITTQGK